MNAGEIRESDPITGRPSPVPGLSCRRFIAYALVICVLFSVVHLLGFRDYTGVLSGTASLNRSHQYFGALYIILYVSFVVIMPVLLIAGGLTGIMAVLTRVHGKSSDA
jgi:hypothetical protein